MKYLFLVLLIAVFCFGQVQINADPMQKMGSSSEIWVDSPAPIQASPNNLEPSISSQPFSILVVITISLSLVVAIMLFSIFNSSTKKKPASQNSLSKDDNQSNFKMIDSCALDNGQNLYIVQFLDRKFLLASSLTNISLIAEITTEIPISSSQKPLASNLDFMTIQSEFTNLRSQEKAKASGFAALLNNHQSIVEEEIINNEDTNSSEEDQQQLEVSPNEIQTSRNASKFQSFFSKKNNYEIPEMAPTEEETIIPKTQKQADEKAFLVSSKSKFMQTETKTPKKPSWLQDKKISNENKFPINMKEKMAADKALKNKAQTNSSSSPELLKPPSPTPFNNSLPTEKLNSASQLTYNINNQKNSIEALTPPPKAPTRSPEPINQITPKTSLRKISIVEE